MRSCSWRHLALFLLLVQGLILFYKNNLFWRYETVILHASVDEHLDSLVADFIASSNTKEHRSSNHLEWRLDVQARIYSLVNDGWWQTSAKWPTYVLQNDWLTATQQLRSANNSLHICQILAGKKVLFVGPETTYYLHTLWLDSLEAHENRSHTCLGQAYCTFHHICRSPAGSNDETEELVGRKKKLPSNNILSATKSALLQYAYSTTLYASNNSSDVSYTRPTVGRSSGVRTGNTYWLRRARKADIIVMNRGPIPAPSSTYETRNPSGKWALPHICENTREVGRDPDTCQTSLLHRVTNAALQATIHDFLPSVLETLHMIRGPGFQGSTRIWQGSWYIQPYCTQKRLPRNIQSIPAFWTRSPQDINMDPWSYFYNAQGKSP